MALRLLSEDGMLEKAFLGFPHEIASKAAQRLISQACIGSGAHLRMLEKLGLLTGEDLSLLLAELRSIYQLGLEPSCDVPHNCTDVCDALHQRLKEKCGAAAERMNIGRHRNDETALAVRLFIRQEIVQLLGIVIELMDEISRRYDQFQHLPLLAGAHLTSDSTVGMWLHAIYEAFYEVARDGLIALEALDVQPLGSGEGFGTTEKVDRAYVAEVLRFSRVQRSFIDVNNSRGKYELRALRWMSDVAYVLTGFAGDCLMLRVKDSAPIILALDHTDKPLLPLQQSLLKPIELLRGCAKHIHAARCEVEAAIAIRQSSSPSELNYATEPLMRASENIAAMMTIVLSILRRLEVGAELSDNAPNDTSFSIQETKRGMRRAISDGEELKFAVMEWNSRLAAAAKKALIL